jgi:hypothetical protein
VGVHIPVEGGDGRLHPRLLDRDHRRPIAQALRCPCTFGDLCPGTLADDQGASGYERGHARRGRRLARAAPPHALHAAQVATSADRDGARDSSPPTCSTSRATASR